MEANGGWLLCCFRGPVSAVIYASAACIGLLAFETRSSIGRRAACVFELCTRWRINRGTHSCTCATPLELRSSRFMVLRHFEQHGFKMARAGIIKLRDRVDFCKS